MGCLCPDYQDGESADRWDKHPRVHQGLIPEGRYRSVTAWIVPVLGSVLDVPPGEESAAELRCGPVASASVGATGGRRHCRRGDFSVRSVIDSSPSPAAASVAEVHKP